MSMGQAQLQLRSACGERTGGTSNLRRAQMISAPRQTHAPMSAPARMGVRVVRRSSGSVGVVASTVRFCPGCSLASWHTGQPAGPNSGACFLAKIGRHRLSFAANHGCPRRVRRYVYADDNSQTTH